MNIKSLFMKRDKEQDWAKYLGLSIQSRKQWLLENCKTNNVSIFTDDENEQSSGIYAELRGVASEAELEKRLYSKLAFKNSSNANIISVMSCAIAFISLIISIVAYFK